MLCDNEFIITDDEERKVKVDIAIDLSVSIRKSWFDPDRGWLGSEMIINTEEWDKIEKHRQEVKKELG